MALRKERLQALHLRVPQPVRLLIDHGLLAEPESRQKTEINRLGSLVMIMLRGCEDAQSIEIKNPDRAIAGPD